MSRRQSAWTENIFGRRSTMTVDEKLSVNLHGALDAAIRELTPSDHPLDRDTDFDVVAFINSKFPGADSLDDIQQYSRILREELSALDEEIHDLVHEHASNARKGREDLLLARDAINELQERAVAIRDRAEESEKTVKTVSRDIMLLDTAKKNVELTVTTLKRLVMMVNACEQLVELAGSREYGQTPALVSSIKDLEGAFDDIKHIPRVDELLKHKARIFNDLKLQIMEDFDLRILVSTPDLQPDATAGPRIMSSKEDVVKIDIAGAAQAADALGDEVRGEIISKYCLLILEEYKKQFSPPSGVHASMEHYEKRLQWLTRALKDFTDRHGNIFPVEWIVNGELCMHYCHETRQHFIDILSSPAFGKPAAAVPPGQPVEPVLHPAELMVAVLIKFIELENDMQRRFDKLRKKLGLPERDHLHFQGVITSCFEPYLSTWVSHEDKQLGELVAGYKAAGAQGDALMGVSVQPEGEGAGGNRGLNSGESVDTDPPLVYTSAVSLFARMRTSLQKCRQINTGAVMASLFSVFKKNVMMYIDTVLAARLPTGKQIAAAYEDSISIACAVVGSLDYCLKMTPHLHKNCAALLAAGMDVSVSGEIHKLADTRELAQESLVLCVLGGEIRAALQVVGHLDWWNCESASGVSAHIVRLRPALEKAVRIIGKALAETHYRSAIEQVAAKLISQVGDFIASAKPISETGAQQLLVDIGEIKAQLLDVPVTACPARRLTQSYSDLVNRSFHRLETTLKALSSPASSDRDALRAMLDALDPELAQTNPTALDKEVDRILALRKGPTSSATLHAVSPMSSLFSSSLSHHDLGAIEAASSSQRTATETAASSATTKSGTRIGKPDLKAEMNRLGASIMKSKIFGAGSSHK